MGKNIRDLDDLREYFETLLKNQTLDIEEIFNKSINSLHNSELTELKVCLASEKDKNKELLSSIQSLVSERDHYKALYEEINADRLSFQKQNTALIEKANSKDSEIEKLRKNIIELNNNSDIQIQNLNNENKEIKDVLNEFNNKYFKINKTYMTYLGLSESIRQRLFNIFGNGDIYLFLSSLTELTTIEELWGFVKRRIIASEDECLGELCMFFNEAFDLFRLFSVHNKYELIIPKQGDSFDSDYHSIMGIKTDGNVQKLLLPGIIDYSSNKVIFKALISVI